MHNDIECWQAISWNNMRLLDPMSITLRILIDTNREPENFLKTNAFYDSKIVGKCPGAKGPYDRVVVRWQHLAFLAGPDFETHFARHSADIRTVKVLRGSWSSPGIHSQAPSTAGSGCYGVLRHITATSATTVEAYKRAWGSCDEVPCKSTESALICFQIMLNKICQNLFNSG